MSQQFLKKPLSIIWGQKLWAKLGKWRLASGLPWDSWLVRILMITLAPLYVYRLGWGHGLHTLLRFIAARGGFTVYRSKLDPGLHIRQQSTDAFVFQQIFILQDYALIKARPKVHCIIDAGAYVGYSAIYFAEMYPHAMIYALEPESGNFQQLLHNTRHLPNIIPIQAALWGQDGWIEVAADPCQSGQWAFTVQSVGEKQGSKQIPAISIATLMDQYRVSSIDIMKMDIEGSESSVFAYHSCHNWLEKLDLLIIELHEHLYPGSEQSFLEAMLRYKYRLQSRGENLILEFQHV